MFAEDTALARIEQQLRVLLGCETPARKVWGMLWSALLPSQTVALLTPELCPANTDQLELLYSIQTVAFLTPEVSSAHLPGLHLANLKRQAQAHSMLPYTTVTSAQ